MITQTFDQFSELHGCSSHCPSFPQYHRAPGGVSKASKRAAAKKVGDALGQWDEQRKQLKVQFDAEVAAGRIRVPSDVERLSEAAQLDTEQGSAARRVLEARARRRKMVD